MTNQDTTNPQPSAELPQLEPDASVREIARAARRAFLGRDLLRSGPGLWPFGQRARTRRDRNRQAIDNAQRRRAEFQQAFEAPRADAPSRARPVDPRTNRIVIAALAGLAVAGVAAAVWLGGDANPDPSTSAVPPATASTTISALDSIVPSPNSATAGGTVAVVPQSPIPASGVAPITPRPHPTNVAPDAVVVVDPPAGDPTPAELATPEGAVRAWLSRLCPFDYHQPFGTGEQRARAAMTETGWRSTDPAQNPALRSSWEHTVAARESTRCAEPTALISPEAPRSASAVIVIGDVTRVITPDGGASYVEQLAEVRIVRLGADGLWRVDLNTDGG